MSKATKYAETLRRVASMQRAHGADDEAGDNERHAAVIEAAAECQPWIDMLSRQGSNRPEGYGPNDSRELAQKLRAALAALEPEGSEE